MTEVVVPTLGSGGDDSTAEIELLLHSLERLRTREGLEVVRLQGPRRSDARPLTVLPAVQRLVRQYGLDEASAAVHVTRYCIAEVLGGTDRVVADVILAAHTMGDVYASAGLGPQSMSRLYSPNLGTRRDALLQCWAQLHNAIGSEVPQVPADRTLRGQLEPVTLRLLARTLWRMHPDQVPTPHELEQVSRAQAQRIHDENEVTPARGKVVVVGGAVMDATFGVPFLPAPDTSREAYSFDLFPGGKGLTQAVAAARMGCRTELIAAVAEDGFGDEIVSVLKAEGVGTAGVRRVPDARSPFTAVVAEGRQSIAMNWRNENEIVLRQQDLDNVRDTIAGADCLLVTFEPSAATVQYLLSDVLGRRDAHPPTILSPGPPYSHQALSAHALSQVNYLVAYKWEIDSMVSELRLPAEHMTTDAVAGRLLQAGIDAVCVPEGTGSKVFSHALGTLDHPGFPPLVGTAGARDAFVAALALCIVESGGALTAEDTAWATAAMAAAGGRPVPLSMPHRRQVDSLVRRSAASGLPVVTERSPAVPSP